MPKHDPRGEVLNPIRSKLAGDISRPLQVLPQLHTSLAREVTVEPLEAEAAPPLEPEPLPSTKLAKPKKVLFTLLEQKENDEVVRQLGGAIGAQTLGWSHVNRALWSLLRRAQDQIDERPTLAPRLIRPSNGNPIEMAKFEDTLAQYLLALFKDMPRTP